MSRVADPKSKISLLRVAEEVFAERGLSGAKVEDIARRAGLSKGAFYLHFESKDAALKQIVESFLARCGAFFAPPSEYPDLTDDPDDLIDFSIARDVRIYDFLWESRKTLQILEGCRGQYDYLVDAFRAEIALRTREWVDHWRREGLFREDTDPDLASTLISGAYHELSLKAMRCAKRPPLEEWITFALETFCRGYGSPELVAAFERRSRRPSGRVEIDLATQGMAERQS